MEHRSPDDRGRASQGKAIWVIAGDDTTIRDVELSGARVPDRNGAGIRQEGANLTVTGSSFHDDEDGILTSANPRSRIVISGSVFFRNGAGDGYSHNLYIGAVRSFTLRASLSRDARGGHLVKSRALRNDILYNRLEGGRASYELDLPDGGAARVIGNVIRQRRATENPAMLAFGEEGPRPGSRLAVVANTFVNDLGRGPAVFVGRGVRTPAILRDDLLTGAAELSTQATARRGGNCVTARPRFARGGFGLTGRSPCVDRGVAPGPGLAPRWEYLSPGRLRPRRVHGRIDSGAYEHRPD